MFMSVKTENRVKLNGMIGKDICCECHFGFMSSDYEFIPVIAADIVRIVNHTPFGRIGIVFEVYGEHVSVAIIHGKGGASGGISLCVFIFRHICNEMSVGLFQCQHPVTFPFIWVCG